MMSLLLLALVPSSFVRRDRGNFPATDKKTVAKNHLSGDRLSTDGPLDESYVDALL